MRRSLLSFVAFWIPSLDRIEIFNVPFQNVCPFERDRSFTLIIDVPRSGPAIETRAAFNDERYDTAMLAAA